MLSGLSGILQVIFYTKIHFWIVFNTSFQSLDGLFSLHTANNETSIASPLVLSCANEGR